MELVERETELAVLESVYDRAQQNEGSVVLVAGEAGIGKSELVRTFVRIHAQDARVLWGGCDDLATPRTLGPFRDIALQVGGDLKAAITSGSSRGAVFDAAIEAVDTGLRPTIVVVEDVHWADRATLDVIKYLGRRIDRTQAILIITYRHEEVSPEHPLTLVVGDLPASSVERIHLAPLSRAAVEQLASDYPGSKDELYAVTQGNPFLVTEVITNPAEAMSASVRDAVSARVARLSPAGRAVAEYTSVVPSQAELWLIDTLPDFAAGALEECRERGLLDYDRVAAWYRHELVREAVEASLSSQRRRELNQVAMETLIDHDADVARIVHHANRAGAGAVIARFAPLAGHQARAAAAHTEALAHFRLAADHITELSAVNAAQLLTDLTVESYYTNEAVDGLAAAEEALAAWRALGDTEAEGDVLRWKSRLLWWLGRGAESEASGVAAVQVLERIPHTRALGMAYSNLAQLSMLAQRPEPAEKWATKAIAVATELGDHDTLAHALNNLGSARVRVGDPTGFDLLEDSLEISLREQLDDHAGRAYANIIWTELDYRRYDDAAHHLEEGLAFAWKRELGGSLYYMTAERARLHLDRGDWRSAENDARWVLSRPEEPGITQMPALATLGRLQVRTGNLDAVATLDAAWDLAEPTGEVQRTAPIVVAWAEHAWLQDGDPNVTSLVEATLARATATAQPWIVDEIAFWLWKCSGKAETPAGSQTPFVLHMTGDPLGAAAAWDRIGAPYERAVALADSGDFDLALEALEIFDGLGAVPAAAQLRRRLRREGVPGVPRGPRRTTRAHPAGLTPRQAEVLELVAEGLSNAEIADRLFVSPKTVDHHVSALLTKLEVSSREEAAKEAAARRLL